MTLVQLLIILLVILVLLFSGPILIIYGGRRLGQRRRWPRRRQLTITLIGLAMWAFCSWLLDLLDLYMSVSLLLLLVVPALLLGGPILIIYGSRRLGHWSLRQQLLTAMVGLAVWAFWAYSPRLIVPPQPSFSPAEARLATRAEQQVRGSLDSFNELVMRMDVTQVVREPEKDRICVVGYSFFYLPVFRYEEFFNRDPSDPLSGGGTARPWPWPCLP